MGNCLHRPLRNFESDDKPQEKPTDQSSDWQLPEPLQVQQDKPWKIFEDFGELKEHEKDVSWGEAISQFEKNVKNAAEAAASMRKLQLKWKRLWFKAREKKWLEQATAASDGKKLTPSQMEELIARCALAAPLSTIQRYLIICNLVICNRFHLAQTVILGNGEK